jgi:enamine deaminase RidA (YjgF/YER057c/UK114 family)
MTDIQRIDAGSRMSEAVIHGDKVYLSGMVADRTIGKSVLEQTTEILQQIDSLLTRAGSDKTRLLKANLADG